MEIEGGLEDVKSPPDLRLVLPKNMGLSIFFIRIELIVLLCCPKEAQNIQLKIGGLHFQAQMLRSNESH